ncbi:Serine/threonine-protein kinase PknB [Enhygromyxa salina]|uniref:Serine/threonine-protein kinase PknB n=2 Tax=Enhygromyxa salina TaxID=215803 RepID=A0A2S9YU15_9BACT|nr:Serine/threonine-protein kinase PknB [Enhygromyxa salina]
MLGEQPTLGAGELGDPGAIPARIGRYVVIEPIGEGGMGLVFSAYDPKLDRKVAVKLVRPALRETDSGGPGDPHRRLLREAQVLAKLSHPNVIHVYEVGALQDQVFITMEYFEGPTLERWQDRTNGSWRETLAIYRAAGRGLEAAHAAGLVHRDFKAQNVLVGADGQVRVIDFGLAREGDSVPLATQLGDEAAAATLEQLTMTGAIMGTPAYMAPEQHADRELDARTDQFSFCVSLYEALYGERPFAGSTLAELSANVLGGKIQPPPRFEEVPAWLRRVLLRGLAVNPDDRYPSITQLLAELGRDRVAWGRWVVAGVGVVALATLGWFGWGQVSEAQRARAQGEHLRVEFGRMRASNAEDELHRLRARTSTQRWDDLVLAWANEEVSIDPTRALASLRHLQDLEANLGAARTIAANAWQRGVARTATPLSGDVVALAVTDLGDFVATLDDAGVVRTWDLGGQLREWPCPETASALAVASGSHSFAVGTKAGTIHLVDSTTGAPAVVTIAAHEGTIHALAFAPDDAALASAGHDHAVRRWALPTGERIDAMTNHDAAVVALAYERGGVGLATASVTGQLGWWDPTTAKVRMVDGGGGRVSSLVVSKATVWAVANDGVITWRPDSTPRRISLAHVAALQLTDEGAVIAVHDDGAVTWSDDNPDSPPRPLIVSAPATRVAHSAGDGGIWLAGPELGVQRWDATPASASVSPFAEGAGALSFSTDGQLLAIVGNRGGLRVQQSTGESVLTTSFDVRPVRASFSPTADRVAVQLIDGSVQLVTTQAPAQTRTLIELKVGPLAKPLELVGSSGGAPHPELVWTPDGRALAFAACFYVDNCNVVVVDADTEAMRGPVAQVPYVSTLAPTPSGDAVLIGRRDQPVVAVLDVASGELSDTSFAGMRLLGQAWTEDGRVRIATAEAETSSIWSWDPESGQRHRLLDEAGFSQLTATEDATAVYMRSQDDTAVLWSIASTRFALVPVLPPGVDRIYLSADGQTLLARGFTERDNAGFSQVLDVRTGQARRLPRLLDPIDVSVAGVVADHQYGVGVRIWDDPTPDQAVEFQTWLEHATNVEVGVEALRAGG